MLMEWLRRSTASRRSCCSAAALARRAPDAQAEGAKLAETALLMMDREGVPLESLFGSLRQNLEEGDLYPSTEVVGLLAGHLAVAVGGQDKATNTQVCQQFLDGILESVYAELAYDDQTTPSSFVGDEADSGETPDDDPTGRLGQRRLPVCVQSGCLSCPPCRLTKYKRYSIIWCSKQVDALAWHSFTQGPTQRMEGNEDNHCTGSF